ncbi:hypothetical protein QBC43DRAFT_210530 [Cladorrhinum sp. PSN259]|nr:hypothetical protein QBC43DRAFT_210530 [Cladorrhinum sp. PSN259]
MARGETAGDGEASGTTTGQSKRPQANRYDSTDSITHHRIKSQKHIVGGGSRLHARVPSSKALHKHHGGLASTTKLNRKTHGSLSPERENGFGQQAAAAAAAAAAANRHHHRRATSELKLIAQDQSSTDLNKNASQVSLKRNRSQGDVLSGKKNKSSSNLHRSASNKAVGKLKSSAGSSKVHFNIGDEDEENEEGDEGEWVDASASASPLLSRRGSTISGTGHGADTPTRNHQQNLHAALPTLVASPTKLNNTTSHPDDPDKDQSPPSNNELSNSLIRNTSHNQYLTSRILSRTPSHGAPPKMSTETALVRPVSPRQESLGESSLVQPPQMRPGSSELASRFLGSSSGRPELTSRFLGENSQGHASDAPGESFVRALNTNKSGLSRAAVNGKVEAAIPRRPRSMGSLSHQDPAARPTSSKSNGAPPTSDFTAVFPEDPNRTQQKLDLARESSGVEQTENPLGKKAPAVLGVFNPEKAPQEQPAVISRIVKRTSMIYDAVRIYQNPIARSIARVRQLPGMHSAVGGQKTPAAIQTPTRTRSSVFNLDSSQYHGGHLEYTHHHHRPVTPRSNLRTESVASSLTEEVPGLHDHRGGVGGGGGRFITGGMDSDDEQRGGESGGGGGVEDVTTALLMKMWDQRPVDLAASHD